MFAARITFILGAGASYEIGLPTGEQLKESISQSLDFGSDRLGRPSPEARDIYSALSTQSRKLGQPNLLATYERKALLLRGALPFSGSIDNALDAHRHDQDLVLCGKLGIVNCILNAERGSGIFADRRSDPTASFNSDNIKKTWFSRFFKLLIEDIPRSEAGGLFSKVRIINFNYDRCVEHFLCHALSRYYGFTDQESIGIVSGLNIYHPYGIVGGSPWPKDNHTHLPFGGLAQDLISLSKEIKTFTEQIDYDRKLDGIRNWIADSEILVFLGFAYHKQNLALLAQENLTVVKRVFGTAWGLSSSDTAVVKTDLKETFKLSENVQLDIRNDLQCVQLFDEFSRSMSSEPS